MEKDKKLRLSKSFKKRHPILNALIVAVAVVAIWRGMWGLMDEYLLPDSPVISFVISLAIGVVVLLIDDFRLDELH